MSHRALLSTATCALIATIATLALGALGPAPARAVELYPSLPPRRAPQSLVIVTAPAPRTVYLEVEVEREPPPRVRAPRPHDPYDTPGSVILGGGAGGLFLFGGAGPRVVPMGYARIAFAVEQAEFGLRLGYAPDALGYTTSDPADPGAGLSRSAALYMASGTFAYRFFEEADVHPVLGAGLGAVVAAPDGQRAAAGFGLSLRAGLELAFPVDEGALAVGLDAEGMQVFGAEDALPVQAGTSLSLAAHLDYHF